MFSEMPKNMKFLTIDGDEIDSINDKPALFYVDEGLLDRTVLINDITPPPTISLEFKEPSKIKEILDYIKKLHFKYLHTRKSIKKRKKHYWR